VGGWDVVVSGYFPLTRASIFFLSACVTVRRFNEAQTHSPVTQSFLSNRNGKFTRGLPSATPHRHRHRHDRYRLRRRRSSKSHLSTIFTRNNSNSFSLCITTYTHSSGRSRLKCACLQVTVQQTNNGNGARRQTPNIGRKIKLLKMAV